MNDSSCQDPDNAGLEGLARDGLAGDRQAFDQFLETATAAAFSFLRRHGEEADVEDAVGAAWVEVIAKTACYDGLRPFQPWFNGVARHKLLSIIRSNRRRAGSGGLEEVAAPFHPGGSIAIDRTFWEDRVGLCWERLTSDDQARIHMRFPNAPDEFFMSLEQVKIEHIKQLLQDNPTCEQIAAELQQEEPGITEDAVKGRIWRALERFRQCLGI